ncbi:dTDP-4-dehydrorhamnose reductase [Marinoscillum pacificum]|uniref:dTDP-4-dehydrorhamnose reductase n=1 Tax=Marinoscillum pacificum TaxID=392723 RepID=UPI0021589D69|nr:dTDP-4-dehydrorhamnose reductase [Marinoscillum pacificum]
MKILVTGSGGQLGSELQFLKDQYSTFEFTFSDYPEMDITNKDGLKTAFEQGNFDFCINCAAYTAVDKAEDDRTACDNINVLGSKNLAELCKEYDVTLFHISTDFVFDGTSSKPLKEDQATSPVNYYGVSKLNGELEVAKSLDKYFIFRTSWLYSTFGNNFVKTMIKLSENRDELNIIADQIGSPTYARDLAQSILDIISSGSTNYGLYHYSNQGVASWYDFTCAIFEYKSIDTKVQPIPTEKYPTPAARPHYSVMDKSKFEKIFEKNIPHWRTSLKKCLQSL